MNLSTSPFCAMISLTITSKYLLSNFTTVSGSSFTAISEKEEPDTVVKLLNKYFDVMVKEIIAQNGLVDKFIGDCIMAVFKDHYHLDRAIDASLAIRDKIAAAPGLNGFLPRVS